MMTQVGLQRKLSLFANKATLGNLYIRLWENNYNFTSTTVAADLTECSATGYAAINLDPADFTVSWDAVEGKAKLEYTGTDPSFTVTGGFTVYGSYLTDATGTEIYAGEDSVNIGTDATITVDVLKILDGQTV